MDRSLVHTFSWGNSYGPMVLKVLQKFPPTLVLVHGWLFPVSQKVKRIRRFSDKIGSKSGPVEGFSLVGAGGVGPAAGGSL